MHFRTITLLSLYIYLFIFLSFTLHKHISFLVILSPPSMAVEALTLSPKPAEIKPLAYISSSSIEPLGHKIWGINFGEDYFVATVTSRASDVDRWIARTINVHRWRLHKLILGLDTECCLPT